MELTFDISKFIIGEYNIYNDAYNAYFKEYLIPAEYVDEINEVKQSDIKPKSVVRPN